MHQIFNKMKVCAFFAIIKALIMLFGPRAYSEF